MEDGLETLFYRGAYKDILRTTVDSAAGGSPSKVAHIIVASLAYQGRMDEAEHHLAKHVHRMTLSQICEANHFLGCAFCRHSRYQKARHYFAKNVRMMPELCSARDKFFVLQGLGFYRYFSGRFAIALRHAQRGLAFATDAKFIFGKGFSLDLIGHCLVQLGQVACGLKMLEEAQSQMALLGNSKWKEAFQISTAVYGAQFGLAPRESIPELQKLFRRLSPQDTYSKANLLLEMGRQWTLRGQIKQAKETLNDACRLIYAVKHRRYSVLLSGRYAHIAYLQGDAHQALHLVQSALKELDPQMDSAIELELRGLERKILRRLHISEMDVESRIRFLNQRTEKAVSRRIYDRGEGKVTSFSHPGDDVLGDVRDLVHTGERDALDRVLTSGFLIFLYELLDLPDNRVVLYFDLVPGSLTCFERGEIQYVAAGVSSTIRKISRMLSQGHVTKELLIRSVWGYKYNPSSHDPLIYRAISRLRGILGKMAHYLEGTHEGYSLHRDIQVRFHSSKRAVEIKTEPPEPSIPGDELNYRQITILEKWRGQRFIDVKSYIKIFRVSEMTARRDLVDLLKRGLANRVGKGRATRYSFTGPRISEGLRS